MTHDRASKIIRYVGLVLLTIWIASGIYVRSDHASLARRFSALEKEHQTFRERVSWVESDELKLQQQLNRIELKLDLAIAGYQLEALKKRGAQKP